MVGFIPCVYVQGCRRKLYTQAEVEALLAALLARIEELELRIAKMQRELSTSSKPPSSDITKPPNGGGRLGAGQEEV